MAAAHGRAATPPRRQTAAEVRPPAADTRTFTACTPRSRKLGVSKSTITRDVQYLDQMQKEYNERREQFFSRLKSGRRGNPKRRQWPRRRKRTLQRKRR